jgi:hypothetical protein
MALRLPTLKAAVLSTLFAVVLAAMLFVPTWFVLAFLSRLITGRIHLIAFILPGAGAVWFFSFSFRMAFSYLREGFSRQA